MRLSVTRFGLVLAVIGAMTVPASAEFFNCHQKPGQVLYSYNGAPSQYGSRSASRSTTHDYSAQSYRSRYQSQATYSGSRHYGNDRSRW